MLNWTKAVQLTYGEDQHGGMSQLDTVKCGHRGCMIVIKPFAPPPPMCKSCMQFLCEPCAAKRELGEPCMPEEKRLDEFEKALRRGMDRRAAQRTYEL